MVLKLEDDIPNSDYISSRSLPACTYAHANIHAFTCIYIYLHAFTRMRARIHTYVGMCILKFRNYIHHPNNVMAKTHMPPTHRIKRAAPEKVPHRSFEQRYVKSGHGLESAALTVVILRFLAHASARISRPPRKRPLSK